MKKLLLFILVLLMAFPLVSCAGANDSEETSSSPEEIAETTETTENFNTTETTETTDCTDCSESAMTTENTELTDTSETTVDHPYGGTGDCFGDTYQSTGTNVETIATETTASVDRYNLGMEYVMEYEALILTDGEEYEPYTSTVYYRNPYMVGDGILMFVSMENQLPHWIDEGVIPHIDINETSDVRFEYDTENAELKHSGRFRIYMQDEKGAFTEVKMFENADLAKVVAYGTENLTGKTVYISYPFLLKTGDYIDLADAVWGDCAEHDIMCIFKTTF